MRREGRDLRKFLRIKRSLPACRVLSSFFLMMMMMQGKDISQREKGLTFNKNKTLVYYAGWRENWKN
jgi:hypothetical protein